MNDLLKVGVVILGCAVTLPSVAQEAPSQSFLDGQQARQEWEAWFGGIQNQVRAGAEYWASHRNAPDRGSCSYETNPQANASWIEGCQEAQRRLAAIDARRHGEPDYRRGFNSYGQKPASTPADQPQAQSETTAALLRGAKSVAPEEAQRPDDLDTLLKGVGSMKPETPAPPQSEEVYKAYKNRLNSR